MKWSLRVDLSVHPLREPSHGQILAFLKACPASQADSIHLIIPEERRKRMEEYLHDLLKTTWRALGEICHLVNFCVYIQPFIFNTVGVNRIFFKLEEEKIVFLEILVYVWTRS